MGRQKDELLDTTLTVIMLYNLFLWLLHMDKTMCKLERNYRNYYLPETGRE